MEPLVVGSVAFDTILRVKRLGSKETTTKVLELRREPGGAGGNVAVALGKLGSHPLLLTSVGYDFPGSEYSVALRELGVDLSFLQIHPTLPTAQAIVVVDDRGDQILYFFPGASEHLVPPRDLSFALGHFAAGEISVYPEIMRRCDRVTFDPGQEVYHRPLFEVASCIPFVDVWFGNSRELAFLEKRGGISKERLFSEGVKYVVETRGKEGAILHSPEESVRIPAVEAQGVDPTGAGDAHRAGFLYSWSRGKSVLESLEVASTLSSFAVEGVGPQSNLPDLSRLKERHVRAFGRWPFP